MNYKTLIALIFANSFLINAFADIKPADKWFVIIHENASADVVEKIPAYADFAKKGTYFSNFHALTNPSQPNYIGLIAGDMFQPPYYDDNTVEFPNIDHPEANSTIIDLIEAKGLSWKVYLENYPGPGFTNATSLTLDTYAVVNTLKILNSQAEGSYAAHYAMVGPQASIPESPLIASKNNSATPEKDQDFKGKIVLVSRQDSSSDEKIKNAQAAGAVGVIIYNTPTGKGSYVTGGIFYPRANDEDDTSITIPTFGISHTDGLHILTALNKEANIQEPKMKASLDLTQNKGGIATYVRKHNPFISFLNISTNPQRASKLVNAQELVDDIINDTVPDFVFYIPNQFNNGHNTNIVIDDTTGIETLYLPTYAGEMFNLTFGLALKTKSFIKDRVIVLTFDENDYKEPTNRIYCAFYGEHVKANNVISTSYNLYDLLRTIETSLGVGTLGRNDANACAMEGWKK